MARAGRHINPGKTRTAHLDGMVEHGFKERGHGKEFGPNTTADQYRDSAEKLLDQGKIGYALKQPKSENILVTDAKLGTASYLNTQNPTRSTHFVPRDGIETFLRDKLSGIPASDKRRLDLAKIRESQSKSNQEPTVGKGKPESNGGPPARSAGVDKSAAPTAAPAKAPKTAAPSPQQTKASTAPKPPVPKAPTPPKSAAPVKAPSPPAPPTPNAPKR